MQMLGDMNEHEERRDSVDEIDLDQWVKVWDEKRTFEAHGLTAPEPGHEEALEGRDQRSYIVSMYPYPSGDLHMGHAEVYSISDVIARFDRLRGLNTLNPIGWDSFGLPAENAAIKRDLHPRTWTYDNIAVQAASFKRLGVSFDWRTRLHTSDPEYYRWNQWIFLKLFDQGLAYRKASPVNWCPKDHTVLANEQVVQGACERCGTLVERRNLTQWFFRITDYAQRLLDDMDQLKAPGPKTSWPCSATGSAARPVRTSTSPSWVVTSRSACSPRVPTPSTAPRSSWSRPTRRWPASW